MSRIVDGRFVLGDEENAFLRETIWALRGFTGVRVLTYCLMSNHIHVLLCVPDESEFAGEEISDEMLVGMVRPLYGKEAAKDQRATDGRKWMGGNGKREYNPAGRNLRNVWTINPQPFPDAHFATFPQRLIEPIIKAATSDRGVCPECGQEFRMSRAARPEGANRT